MLAAINIQDLTRRIRSVADVKGDFHTDEEIKDRIKEVYDNLYFKIVELNEGTYVKQVLSDPVSPGSNEVPLPSDFYRMRNVELKRGDYYRHLQQTSYHGASLASGILIDYWYWGPDSNWKYLIFSDHIKIFPKSNVSGNQFRLTYTSDPDFENNPDLQKGFENYLIYQVAYLLGVIQQNPVPEIGSMAQGYMRSVMEWASSRDSSTQVVQEVEGYF